MTLAASASWFQDAISWTNDKLYGMILIYLLIGAGIYFTIRTRGMQFRLFGRMVKTIASSRDSKDGGISSFQAFAIGLASRVGTGNIAGVAIAITLGGPGAVFWMWMVAIFGMATAFIEATLAQVFKMKWRDGTFRGGPAFYIYKGLNSWGWGAAFAVALLFTFGIAFEMVQANTIASTFEGTHGVPSWVTAIVLAVLTSAVIFGGIKAVARVTEWIAPIMAAVYVLIAIIVVILNFRHIPDVFTQIFLSAFGLREAFAGTAGGIFAAFLQGARRGLFSNEAGMGSAPNAASTATTRHPARQGLIQSAGVFVDTMVVCTATAFIILSAGIYKPGQEMEGATLTQMSVTAHIGEWMTLPMSLLIFVFAYSSIIGNYAYAEVNADYLFKDKGDIPLRIVVVASVAIGSMLQLNTVWNLADVAMGAMAIINLVSILILGKWALGALKDYEANPEGAFIAANNPHLPGKLETHVWTAENAKQWDE